jgi:hypothetical protein
MHQTSTKKLKAKDKYRPISKRILTIQTFPQAYNRPIANGNCWCRMFGKACHTKFHNAYVEAAGELQACDRFTSLCITF